MAKFRYPAMTRVTEIAFMMTLRAHYILEADWNLVSKFFISKNVKIKIYKTTVLHVDSHGCETWSLALTDEYRLRFSTHEGGSSRRLEKAV
jgi:hypothetical protein